VTVLTEQESSWVSELAGRLRLIQADAAAAVPEQRRDYLQDELARALKPIPPAQRKRYLEAVLSRFPVAGQVLKPAAPAPETVDETLNRLLTAAKPLTQEKRSELAKRLAEAGLAPVRREEPITVDEALNRLLETAKSVVGEKRAHIAKRLAEVGLAPVGREVPTLEASEKLRQGFRLDPGQQVPLARLEELTLFLVDALCLLDHNALKTMRELSPRSPLLKRTEDFRTTAARFLVKDDESLEPAWGAIRGLLGALLAAVQGGLKNFGRQYVDRFSPSGIEAVVMGEGGGAILGIGKSRKERCWEKYTRLSEDYDTPDLVDRRIKDSLAAFVENLLRSGR
jgi:hypothetical protein